MRYFLVICLIAVLLMVLGFYCESKKNPYEEGMHMDYNIVCENGFVYKILGDRQGVIQIFNSDGTPLKCGEKIK